MTINYQCPQYLKKREADKPFSSAPAFPVLTGMRKFLHTDTII